MLSASWFDTGWRSADWLNEWEIPFGRWIEESIDWLNVEGERVFDVIKWPFENLLDLVTEDILLNIPWPFMLLIFVILGFLVRDIKVGVAAAAGIFICGVLGADYWELTMETIGIIMVAVIICVAIGLPYGVLCARSDRVWNITRPILDGMQLVHAFTYLIAIIFFFGTGPVGGTIATMIFALPPMIRLTNLGIRQVPEDVVEAARAYGASDLKVLVDVQLPLARPAIMTGVNQVLLLSLSFVGIIAVIAGGGLGQEVYRGIQSSNASIGAASGLALYLVGVVMDRLSQPDSKDNRTLIRKMVAAFRSDYVVPPALSAATLENMDESASSDADSEAAPETMVTRPPLSKHLMIAGLFGLLGGAVAVVSVFLNWVEGAGRISGYSRPADLELDGSFNGHAASGGSWFGIAVLVIGIVLVIFSLLVLFRGRDYGTSWLSVPQSLAAAGAAIAGIMVFYLLIAPHDLAGSTTHGIGTYLALIGGLVLLLGAIVSYFVSTRSTTSIQFSSVVALVTLVAVGFLIVGSFSNWVSDTRPGALTPELQRQIELERENPTDQGTAILNRQLVSGDPVRFNGFDSSGPNLSWSLVFASIAAVAILTMTLLASRMAALLNAMTLGIGAAVILSISAWTVSFLRVADNGLHSGPAAVPSLIGGGILALIAVSRMRRQSFDERETAETAAIS